MKYLYIFLALIIGLGVLYGSAKFMPKKTTTTGQVSPVVTITGKISAIGPAVSIASESGKAVEITSRKIDFTKYHNQTVTVTGQFSGTTLYVDKIK